MGEQGYGRLARINHANAVKLADHLAGVEGVEIVTPSFFNEFTIRTPRNALEVIDELADRNVLGGVRASRLWPGQGALDDLIVVASTEVNTDEDRAAYASALKEVLA